MPTRQEINDFFKRSVVKYNKGDILELRNKNITSAGPFLIVILNGIDNLGGMCYGFGERSPNRSIKFMKEKMGISESLANLLYKIVRCGIVHQGMPKIGLKYSVENDCYDKDVFYKHADEYIYLNVSGLVTLYLKTVDDIASDIDRHIFFVPPFENISKDVFDLASSEIHNEITALAIQIGSQSRIGMNPDSSCSAYTPDNTFNISIDLPAGP